MSGTQPMPEAAAGGQLYVVSAPSGAGKTSLVRALVAADPRVDLSVSHTTRAPRSGETDGEHYHFVGEDEFVRMIEAGAFVEHAEVFGRRYGTARAEVEERLRAGRDVILEIDWQGARQVRASMPGARGIFVLPPSIAALAERLRSRAQDSAEVIEGRMRAARREIEHYQEFDYLIVNERFDDALAELGAILAAERARAARRRPALGALIDELLESGGATR